MGGGGESVPAGTCTYTRSWELSEVGARKYGAVPGRTGLETRRHSKEVVSPTLYEKGNGKILMLAFSSPLVKTVVQKLKLPGKHPSK